MESVPGILSGWLGRACSGSSFSEIIRGFVYEIALPEQMVPRAEWPQIKQKGTEFLASSSFQMVRDTKNKTVIRDIRPFVKYLELSTESGTLRFCLLLGKEGSVKPAEILTEVLGLDKDIVTLMRIRKEKTLFTP